MAVVKTDFEKMLFNGNQLFRNSFEEMVSDDRIRVYDTKGNFTGIYKFSEDKKCYVPEKMFIGM